ncbi:hypothetical protein MmiHf6_14890 [Methanimicrococcus hongohii]|uniref:Uncharacterized protein n=1 Tax=Methanimicrococcus hongohii TaxID=3028295 RepID=A0AA96V1J9_9EURY|nr:hypothetical protein [Methanimicrococcus sp. Hf6]WNY24160.1 hypothetical protein MmiHf6_14890 [Methanimicrococcus sp. Hf6]
MNLNVRKEVLDSTLFIFLLFIYVLILYLMFIGVQNSSISLAFAFFILFASVIYALLSKNIVSSFLIGFLLWPIYLVFNMFQSFPEYGNIFDLFAAYFGTIGWTLVMSIIWGLPGYFLAQHLDNKNRKMMLIAFGIMFFIITFVIYIFIMLD